MGIIKSVLNYLRVGKDVTSLPPGLYIKDSNGKLGDYADRWRFGYSLPYARFVYTQLRDIPRYSRFYVRVNSEGKKDIFHVAHALHKEDFSRILEGYDTPFYWDHAKGREFPTNG